MRKLLPVVLVLVLALAGCQQQQSAPPPHEAQSAPAPAPPPKSDPRPVIACFGDSLTAGAGLDEGKSFPDLLQRDLDGRGYHYRVMNFGQSGYTTQDGLTLVDSVLAEKPALVLLEFGANDGLRGQPIANAEGNLAHMIETLQNAHVPVVLAGMTLPPNYTALYIQRFEAMYKTLAKKYKLHLIPFLLEGVGGHADLMQQDGLHPNATGTRIVEATVFQALEPLLRKD